MKKLLLPILVLGAASCAQHAIRIPSSEGDKSFIETSKLSEAYNLNLEINQLYDQRQILQKYASKNNSDSSDAREVKLSDLNNSIEEKSKLLSNLDSEIKEKANDLRMSNPASLSFDYENDYRIQNEKLIIQNPENYKLLNGDVIRKYSMNLNGVTHYQLGIVNLAFGEVDHKTEISEEEGASDTRRYFDAIIKCDANFKLKKRLFNKKINSNNEYRFKIYEQNNDSAKIVLSFNKEIEHCTLKFNDPENPEKKYGVELINDRLVESKINNLRNKVDVCLIPDNKKLKGIEKFFLNSDYQSMTCAQTIHEIKTLEIPVEGVKSKAEALLGQALPNELIVKKDPYLDLDFSKAPKLNTILISYLVFRADFYGHLMARLVKWHADHGTIVKILASDVITLKKDKQMLYDLQESSNNIKIQEFRYENQGMGLWDFISEFHRTMHVKLLITLSDIPENNMIFFGGRNIHDGFIYKEVPDHSNHPEMVQYGSGKGKDESYTHWRDFEMRIKSKELAEKVTSHLQTLWEKDSKTMFVRSINYNVPMASEANQSYFENKTGPLVRHFISIPYKDEHALEKFYAHMLDSAEKSIRISTPYFRPTKLIGEAMSRAVQRGVDVSLITRIDLSGDTAAIILGEVNKAGINQFLHKIKIYEYTEPSVILHSKLVLIDGKYSFIGSVNLNKRSFVHDTENGIMVYDKDFNQRMNSIMDTYKQTTREVLEKQKIAFWKRVVIGVFDEEF
jgi:cardiolipin synthase